MFLSLVRRQNKQITLSSKQSVTKGQHPGSDTDAATCQGSCERSEPTLSVLLSRLLTAEHRPKQTHLIKATCNLTIFTHGCFPYYAEKLSEELTHCDCERGIESDTMILILEDLFG